jgi:hypothetical protein
MKSIFTLSLVFLFLFITSCDSVNIYGTWQIDEVKISGYEESEKLLYDQLEENLKGGKIEIHLDGKIDTYSNVDGKESIITKTYEYNGSDSLCIFNDDNSKNCLTILEWNDDVMKSQTKDGDLTINMTFKRVK